MSVKRHAIYNLLGSVSPMLVSVVTVPAYLHLIGDARYGVLAIVWLFLGYFGLFDPGITRAATFHIARLHRPDQAKERESVFWTALAVNTAFGLVAGIAVYLIARPLFIHTFRMPAAERVEVLASLPWLAASATISVATGVLSGTLQARDQFGYFNAVTVVTVLLTQLAPLAVAYWHGPDLAVLIPTVLLARMLGAIPNFIGIARSLPLGIGGGFDRSRIKVLFSYGGWITVTNLLNPILTTMDRMLIGSLLSAEAVAFYTVPFNLVTRVSVLPGAVATSLFPKLSRESVADSTRMASEAVVTLSAIMTPALVAGIGILPIFMQHWVGRDFAAHAAPVGIVLMIGVWINGLSYIPAGHLQAINRPDLPAKFHAAELVPFLGALWLGLHYFGLIGAAWAWTLRVTIDGALLFVVARQIPGWRRILPGGMILLIAAISAPTVLLSIKSFLALLAVIASVIWSWSVSPLIRDTVKRYLMRATVPEAA
jgi:O-antigen/teichoic acid export membrane protein